MIDYSKINTGTPIKEYKLDSIKFNKFVNTRYFSEAARQYEENSKLGYPVYTRALVGSREFEEYWDLQEQRCRDGFKVGDLYITGRQYFYLNFFRILRSPSKDDKDRNKVSSQQQKEEGFPSFWAIQYLWFSFTHIARYGGTFLGVQSQGGLDVCALKTRGAGFSFMDACDDVYNYNFIRNSKSFIFAYSSNFLTGLDGIMPKIQVALNFLNNGTCGLMPDKTLSTGTWLKNRYDIANEPMKFDSGYKDLNGDIRGYNSLIGGIIADNPRKIRAGRAMKLTLEEGGSFPNLLDIEASTQALVKDGSIKTGSRSLFGTGGEIGAGIEGLETIFNNPLAFGFMGFPNIWEGELDEVGFFCPSYLADAGCMDKDGNSDIAKHIETQNDLRLQKKNVSKAIEDKHTAEFPFVPSEALKRLSGNIFDSQEVDAQIRRIEFRKVSPLRYGELEYGDYGKVIFQPKPNANPILKYPHDQDKNLDGCITILQAPYAVGGKTPQGMYFIVVDNYGIDEATDKTSLFSAYVYKYPNVDDISYSCLPVAWYNGRPASQEKVCFENLLKMSLFYGNAEIMGERNAAGQQVISFFKRKHLEHLLMDELDITTANVTEKRKKPKFMAITADQKIANLQYYAESLLEERYEVEDEENGETKIIKNIHCIEDLGSLEEMKKFNLRKGNFDRISANSMAPIIIKQKRQKGIESLQKNSTLAAIDMLSNFQSEYTSELISEY